ncbi:MAG: glycosyl transferase family 1, partial [Flavobacteriales bacterium]|nr:glycosyl transferase family 1 [Flavobacteriales bacterium]
VSKKYDIPWLADFRDPWTFIDFQDKLMMSKWAQNRNKSLEKSVFDRANVLVTVSPSWGKRYEQMYDKNVIIIKNGFDPEDFDGENVEVSKKFSLSHVGSLNEDRNPEMLWECLRELSDELPSFKDDLQINFIGSTDHSVRAHLEQYDLKQYSNFEKYLPHKEAIRVSRSSQVLLLLLNDTPNIQGIIPGKLYEYLASKRPILCIGSPRGDSAQIIKETEGGKVVDFKDKQNLKTTLKELYEDFTNNQLTCASKDIDQFSRKLLCGKIVEQLNMMTK